jgi:hypothetical protein
VVQATSKTLEAGLGDWLLVNAQGLFMGRFAGTQGLSFTHLFALTNWVSIASAMSFMLAMTFSVVGATLTVTVPYWPSVISL